MFTCVFWNLHQIRESNRRSIATPRRDNLLRAIRHLAIQEHVDLFLFAECPIVIEILQVLNSPAVEFADVRAVGWQNQKVVAIARERRTVLLPITLDDPEFDEDKFDHTRLSLFQWYLGGGDIEQPIGPDLLLAAVHLVDKSNFDTVSQREEARRIARRIRFVEKRRMRHFRTIAVGDFNMDPYEEGMTLPDAFHSVAFRQFSPQFKTRVADLEETVHARTIDGAVYPFFYNPMWSLWGDGHNHPGGTYLFKESGSHLLPRWHMLDQVLVRPAALEYFDNGSRNVRVLSGLSAFRSDVDEYFAPVSLVVTHPDFSDGDNRRADWTPDIAGYSDHLPLLFQIREPND